MLDETWGLKPVLFYIGKYPVEAYPVFLLIAIATGIGVYVWQLKKDGIRSSNALYIAIFAIFGGTIGAKLPLIFIYWNELNSNPDSLNILLSGRTIVGGLIGGAAGTFLAKKMFGIKDRLGNQLAIPVAVAMAVGRIGCLLRGCCYGQPTALPWGVDFGDHIFRHPTQVYEIIFDLSLVCFLIWKKKKELKPGELFRTFLNSYLSFRFLLEFIRVEKISSLGLTDFQLLCVISLIYINRKEIFNLILGKKGKRYERQSKQLQ
ncbi:MAG: prolipoprotein diacylglyceryl transferase [Clostridia bacterium]|jgi:prolipoprotein diacylglyceryltransferase|nr:prolipoprotein diacylglyceryl transferase [Clostridia bacterium]